MMDCVREVLRGGTGAYAGYGTALVRVLPQGHHAWRLLRTRDACKDPRTGSLNSQIAAVLSGGRQHGARVQYPLHLARTVLQQPVPEGGRAFSGFVDVLSHRMQTQGVAGCFRGLPIWLCNRVPAVAIEFAVNERALDGMKRLAAWRGVTASARGKPNVKPAP